MAEKLSESRRCRYCGAEIFECMGFVDASDFVRALNGEIAPAQMREMCGKCDTRRYADATGRAALAALERTEG